MPRVNGDPRKFVCKIVEVAAVPDPLANEDSVVLQFQGRVRPSTRKRMREALEDGRYAFEEKHKFIG